MPPKKTRSLQKRIFWELSIIGVLAGVIVTLACTAVFQETVLHDAHDQLSFDCSIVASRLNDTSDKIGAISELDLGKDRVTLIASDGTVIYDSDVDASGLENHGDRPEVADAEANGTGSAERRSDTVGYVSIYEATRLDDGSVLRLSEDAAGILAILRNSLNWVLLILALLVAVCWYVSRLLAQSLVTPILEIDPTNPGKEAPYRELEPLVVHLREQQGQLEDQMEQLRSADAMRREFTANVTHELKTPISSISGASELIRDGIVRPEDIGDFAGRIYNDAQRLSALVSDILTLSKLDESERSRNTELLGTSQMCDLNLTARDVCDRLQERARASRVTLIPSGSHAELMGYATLIDELVSNLVDNAIRYNVPGGTVWIITGKDEKTSCPYLIVSDTGVGIPEDARDKVFERFYRVDKSRSRANGGTGLGLAIVKHAANVHGATISLDSTLGKGTTIRVDFPKQQLPGDMHEAGKG